MDHTTLQVAGRDRRLGRTAITVIAALTVITVAMVLNVLWSPLGVQQAHAAAADPIRERGVVARVVDGDTIDVLVDGGSETRIRLSGIQAFEAGECGADIATDRLTTLVEGKRVELRAHDANATSLGRPIRSVHLPLASGGTADINELLLLEGMGLWFPLGSEVTDIADYHVAATHARRLGRGIWRDDLCGRGPQHGHPIDMWVKSDADGNDGENLNDECVRIVNRHASVALDLSGWLVRESSQFRFDPSEEGYRFPSRTVVPAGASLVVRVGSGTTSALEHFMGSPSALFDNADRTIGPGGGPGTGLGMGDGVYLLDPRGNIRQAFTWPCVVDCSTPLFGALVIDHVEYDPPGVDTADNEYVELRNTSSSRIHLDGYQLRNRTVFHEFVPGTYLDADEVLRVTVGRGTQSRLQQYWGQDGPILRNAGDWVDVVSFDERFVDCVDWGSERPCPWPVTVPGAGTTGVLPTEPELAGAAPPEPGPFPDVPLTHLHVDSISWLVEEGITSGCGGGLYCPDAEVTRGQMATFLTAALELTPGDGSVFPDVGADHPHVAGIGALVDEGITSGCPGGGFCPADPVTRGQMATFLTTALGLPPGDGSGFVDVGAGHPHVAGIGALVEARITGGCGGGAYCPSQAVTRAQMATFLRNALT